MIIVTPFDNGILNNHVFQSCRTNRVPDAPKQIELNKMHINAYRCQTWLRYTFHSNKLQHIPYTTSLKYNVGL